MITVSHVLCPLGMSIMHILRNLHCASARNAIQYRNEMWAHHPVRVYRCVEEWSCQFQPGSNALSCQYISEVPFNPDNIVSWYQPGRSNLRFEAQWTQPDPGNGLPIVSFCLPQLFRGSPVETHLLVSLLPGNWSYPGCLKVTFLVARHGCGHLSHFISVWMQKSFPPATCWAAPLPACPWLPLGLHSTHLPR